MNKSQIAPRLRTQGLAIGYRRGRQQAIVTDEINVELRAGELVALIGPNGAGKSTLMRTLAGLQPPLAGQIYLEGDELAQLSPAEVARRLAVVLTDRVDVGNLSAYGLVALGRHPYTNWQGKLTAHDEAIVRQALIDVDGVALAHRPIIELSDGERQKIMVARALAQEAPVLLLDEPTAFLDLPRRVELMRLLGTLSERTGRAILLSTHDLELALRVADRLWLLPPGGPLTVGIPEALALDGSLHDTFQSEGVEFDAELGSFRLNRTPLGNIAVEGEGLLAHWTRRALERIGYAIVPDGHSARTRVIVEAAAWRLNTADSSEEFTSLEALVERLRRPSHEHAASAERYSIEAR